MRAGIGPDGRTLRGLRPGSQNARIVAYLADGREREMRDIHYAVGFCRLNSRVSELRSHGWRIDCRREGSNWFYRLVSVPDGALTEREQGARPRLLSASDQTGPAGRSGDSTPSRSVSAPQAHPSDAWATRPDTTCAAGSGPVPVSVAASDLQLELPVAA